MMKIKLGCKTFKCFVRENLDLECIKLTISLASFKIMKPYMHSGLGSFYGFLKLCLNVLSFVGFPLEMA